MDSNVLIAGAGGQGVMLLGFTLANAAIREGKKASCMPSYGPEMRGGTANCTVTFSDEEVVTPIVNDIQSMIIMNQLSYDRFKDAGGVGCLVVANSSLVESDPECEGQLRVPCNEVALGLGNIRAANMVALGAYLKRAGTLRIESALAELETGFSGNTAVIELNQQAIQAGAKSVSR